MQALGDWFLRNVTTAFLDVQPCLGLGCANTCSNVWEPINVACNGNCGTLLPIPANVAASVASATAYSKEYSLVNGAPFTMGLGAGGAAASATQLATATVSAGALSSASPIAEAAPGVAQSQLRTTAESLAQVRRRPPWARVCCCAAVRPSSKAAPDGCAPPGRRPA